MTPFAIRVVLSIVAVLSGSLQDRPGGFRTIGPGGGGAMFHPTISAHDPSTVLVHCDMTGAYLPQGICFERALGKKGTRCNAPHALPPDQLRGHDQLLRR